MRGLSINLKVLAAAVAIACALAPASTAQQVAARDPDTQALRGSEAVETVLVQAPRPPRDPDYRLGSGDKVRVIVYGEDDLGGEFQVAGSGTIQLPLIGQTKAVGLTARGLADTITAALADGYLKEPRVSVEVTTYRPFYIIGEVNKPGEYAYVDGMTAINAVALAGGYTQRADDGELYVRKENETLERSIDADQLTKIHPGDVIRVPQSTVWAVASFLAPITSIFSPICSIAVHTYC